MTSDKLIPLKGLRGMIARNLSQAWQAPRVAQGIRFNVSSCQALIEQQRQETGKKVTITHLLIKALAQTLQNHPLVNATLSDAGVQLHDEVNIALAVATDAGLLVPVIRNVQSMSTPELVDAVADLAEKARSNNLPASAFQGGTFTLSALGKSAVEWFTPVLNPPQVGILGAGSISETALVVDGEIAIAPVMELTLVFDHRALDGHPAAQFLSELKQRLEQAEL
ncbi:dihydrolipoamide acetyltransferase family protein [Pseudohalioglobus lutimaris]|uniref:2-oxo acid dehydrogenase subunit E2 n=1 Tax=Pseudohalioglobus lutimaris TaxID=1737061 RepID=A0A2N5X5U5_9GAMM|nr:dihydrolipoamide acetyltransferase family protein [Pseudohalioglobus lutimaris]PLW69853.1 2-oxo acid dehydrogenase subunit E2 [Pseudohalioglobus lutimaris]